MSNNRNTDHDWEIIAGGEPYWGVLSADKFKTQNLTLDSINEFMESGSSYVDNLLKQIRKLYSKNFHPKRSLDFGCGVGRVLIPLGKVSSLEAIGLDIAPSMLLICQENIKKYGKKNTKCLLSDDLVSKASGKFDLINTCIVLQHIPQQRGYAILEALIEKLESDGFGSVQVTYAKSTKFLIHEQVFSSYYRKENNSIYEIKSSGWELPNGSVTMFDYDLNQLFAILSSASKGPITCIPTNDDSHLGIHFIFQKK